MLYCIVCGCITLPDRCTEPIQVAFVAKRRACPLFASLRLLVPLGLWNYTQHVTVEHFPPMDDQLEVVHTPNS